MIYGYDSILVLLLPAILLFIYAQFEMPSTFNQSSNVYFRAGYTGAQAATAILHSAAFVAVLQLVRFILIAQGRNRDE